MKISRKSWHYRLVSWWWIKLLRGQEAPPRLSRCQYFSMLFGVFFTPLLIAAGLAVVVSIAYGIIWFLIHSIAIWWPNKVSISAGQYIWDSSTRQYIESPATVLDVVFALVGMCIWVFVFLGSLSCGIGLCACLWNAAKKATDRLGIKRFYKKYVCPDYEFED